MFSKAKKKIGHKPKRKIITYLILAMLLCVAFFITVFYSIYQNYIYYYSTHKDDEDTSSSLEYFEISGTYAGSSLNMKFSFPDFEINDISGKVHRGSFNIKKEVSIPTVIGNSDEETVFKFYKKAGYTTEGICGIMGCLYAESSFNPAAVEGDNFWTGRNNLKRGYGIAQWTNTKAPYTSGRRTNIINYLKSNGYDPYTKSGKLLKGQLKYTLIEKGYDRARNLCKNATSIEKSTEDWLRYYEGAYNKSYYMQRLKYARGFYAKYKKGVSSGDVAYENVKLIIYGKVNGKEITFSGTLDGIDIAGSAKIKSGKLNGGGEYGQGASAANGSSSFTGAEKSKNAIQERIVNTALSFNDPYNNGYKNLCEGWVGTVYRNAGLKYNGACCAAHSRELNAIRKGKIPVGAVIYSSPTYKSGVKCSCGRDAGHVAIYIGDGKVAGSQLPFIMSLSDFINLCGYGGYSFSGNKVR